MGQGTGLLTIFLIITLLGTLWLEQILSKYVGLELALIVGLIIVALVLLSGSVANAKWTWPLAVLFFAVSAANISLIYYVEQEAFLQYSLLLGWVVLGFIWSATKTQEPDLAPYGTPMHLEDIMPDVKIASKTTVKKAKKSKSRKSKKRKKR